MEGLGGAKAPGTREIIEQAIISNGCLEAEIVRITETLGLKGQQNWVEENAWLHQRGVVCCDGKAGCNAVVQLIANSDT